MAGRSPYAPIRLREIIGGGLVLLAPFIVFAALGAFTWGALS